MPQPEERRPAKTTSGSRGRGADAPGGWRGATRRGSGGTTPFGKAEVAGYTAMESGGLWAWVGQDLFDDLWLLDEGDDPHGAGPLGIDQGVGFANLFGEVCPPVLEGPRDRGRWDLDHLACIPPGASR